MYRLILILAFMPILADAAAVRPSFNGSFDDAARASALDGSNRFVFCGNGGPANSGCVPSGGYYGVMIRTADASHDINIADIACIDSNARCFQIGNRADHTTLTNIEAAYFGALGIHVGYNAKHTMIRDSDIHHGNWCAGYFRYLYPGSRGPNAPDSCESDAPPMVNIARNDEDSLVGTWTIYENNDIYHHWGEGIGAFFGAKCLVRGNRLRDGQKIAIYIADSPHCVVESNIMWNSGDRVVGMGLNTNDFDDNDSGDLDYAQGMSNTVESNLPFHSNTIEVVYRNNLSAAIQLALVQSNWTSGGTDKLISSYWYNNTAISEATNSTSTHAGFRFAPSSATNSTTYNRALHVFNNIGYFPNMSGSSVCDSVNYNDRQFDYNYFSSAPDAVCRGSNDVAYGKPDFARDADTFDKANWTTASGPTFAMIELQAGDPGLNAGKSLQATKVGVLGGEFDDFSDLTFPFTPTVSNFNKQAGYDALGNLRSATPNIGASEAN